MNDQPCVCSTSGTSGKLPSHEAKATQPNECYSTKMSQTAGFQSCSSYEGHTCASLYPWTLICFKMRKGRDSYLRCLLFLLFFWHPWEIHPSCGELFEPVSQHKPSSIFTQINLCFSLYIPANTHMAPRMVVQLQTELGTQKIVTGYTKEGGKMSFTPIH